MIKTINKDTVNQIIEERKNGLFSSFTDFYKRVKLNSEQYHNLIYSSCFNGCKKDMVNYVKYHFDSVDMIKNEEYSINELVDFEESSLGFNLKYSILDSYKNNDISKDIKPINELNEEIANVLVHIKSIKEITTKKNEKMSFITIYDGISTLEVTLFPDKFNEITNELNKNNRVKYMKDVCLLKLKPTYRNDSLNYEIIKAYKF